MSYFIYRNQQQYGPYTLQDLQSQVAGGTMVAADQARDTLGGPWTTVGDILAQASQYTPLPVPPAYPGISAPGSVPLPPNLHWAVVLLIGIVFSPFLIGWQIYQTVWVRNIDKESKALLYYLIAYGSFILCMIVGLVIVLKDPNNPNPWGVLPLAIGSIALLIFIILSIFDLRRSMLAYYNTVEPIGLRLSGVMTFFFNVYYFQYHMSRIATWKLTGYLPPQV
jgi:hypothetical protein